MQAISQTTCRDLTTRKTDNVLPDALSSRTTFPSAVTLNSHSGRRNGIPSRASRNSIGMEFYFNPIRRGRGKWEGGKGSRQKNRDRSFSVRTRLWRRRGEISFRLLFFAETAGISVRAIGSADTAGE